MLELHPRHIQVHRISHGRPPSSQRRWFRNWSWRRWTVVSVVTAVILVLLLGGWVAFRAIASLNTQKNGGQRVGFFQQLKHLVTSSDEELRGESEDRVNVLLMGIGGPGHDGPYLTDTLMVISYQPSTKRVAMISIPRDLVVNIPEYNYRKINGVLSIGRDQKYPGGGEALVVKVVSELLNIPIQYYARVDFTGFKDVIDRVDGVEVNVEKAFADYSYPNESYGYQTVRFSAGKQTMNGDQALKFARSRHGTGGEGSDFARAKRQQKILAGLKEKIVSAGTLLNPVKASDILKALGEHSQTNMEVWEILRLASIAKDIDANQIINRVLDDRTGGLLRSATGTGGAYILIPRTGTYAEIEFLAGHVFDIAAANVADYTVQLINASRKSGLAERASQGLIGFGFGNVRTATGATAHKESVILNGTGERVLPAIGVIGAYLHITQIMSPIEWADATGDRSVLKYFPSSSNTNAAAPPNILVVFGTDQPTPPKSIFNVNVRSTTNTNRATPRPTSTNSNRNTNRALSNTNRRTTNSNTNSASSPENSNVSAP